MPVPRNLPLRPRPVPPHPGNARARSPQGEVARAKVELPGRAEVDALIGELLAELADKDDRATVQRCEKLCRQLADTAAARLGVLVTGREKATVPNVTKAAIALLTGAGVLPGARSALVSADREGDGGDRDET